MVTMTTLSMELASKLCQEIQDNQFIKIFTQCWGCVKFAKGDPEKMCGGIVECNLVLKRYQEIQKTS